VVDKLKQIANGLFITDISTSIVEEVPNLTVRKGTTLATTAALKLSGTLTVNGTLELGNTAVITGVETAQGEGTLALGTQDFGPKAGIFLGVKNVTSTAVTITAEPLTVPAGTSLTLTGAINTGLGTLVVEEGAVLTATTGTFATHDKPLTINGTATFTAATFDAAIGDIQIDGSATFGTAVVSLGDVKVNGTITLEDDLTLAVAGTKSLTLGTGAKLIVDTAQKLLAGVTEITGAWQAASGTVIIKAETADTASIAGGELTAGAGAKITQPDGSGNGLTIAADTTINLGGSASTAGGSIVLTAAASDAAKLNLAAATSKIVLGAGDVPGAANPPGVNTPTIGGKDVIITGLTAVDFKIAGGVLVQIGGTGTGSITADTTDDVTIDSRAAFDGAA
jgi:hypothetical protein